MKKYKYNINNLDCASCAREIEESLNDNKDFKNVVVNFSTSKLSYESEKDFSIKELNELIKKVEPEADVSKEEVEVKKEFHLSILLIALLIGSLGYFINFPFYLKVILYIISYSLLLYRTFINAVKLLIKSRTINENALITISCIGALIIGEVVEGMLVITLYTIGKILEEKAINNSRKSIKDLLDIKQPYANKKEKNKIEKINVEDIEVNDILVVKKGEKIPVDGIITKGSTILDTSALTGEQEPVNKSEQDSVLSGCINLGDVIEMKVTSEFENSTVAKILELLDNATDKKTKTETAITKFSKIYTPVIIIMAVLIMIFLPIVFNVDVKDSVYRGLTFLVISCPCAIAISVPLSYFTGIGVSSKNGILVKGSNYLDLLSRVNKIVFDKTGTLTSGAFKVTSFNLLDSSYSEDYILKLYALGENLSNHPIAKSIMNYVNIDVNEKVKNHKEIEGLGVSYTYDDKKIKIGNNKMFDIKDDGSLNIYLSIDDKIVSSLTINDGIKEGVENTLSELSKKGIETYMFTGDSKENALSISEKLNIDKVYYELLPTEKYEKLEELLNDKDVVAFIGDGINDAPSLKRADIGISMGSIGSSSAIEASDIVIMDDDISKINKAISISNKVKRIIKENLVFSIGVKILILVLSAIGIANMWQAVFADVGVTIISILNTLRIMKK